MSQGVLEATPFAHPPLNAFVPEEEGLLVVEVLQTYPELLLQLELVVVVADGAFSFATPFTADP